MDKTAIIAMAESRLTQLNLAGYADPIEEFKEIYKLIIELTNQAPSK